MGGCIALIHTHPSGLLEHSEQDDREEAKLFQTAFTRVHGSTVHGSLVLTDREAITGRVWTESGYYQSDVVRVVGDRIRFFYIDNDPETHPSAFDRQVRAFGAAMQALLKRLRIGVVGAGGTGSCVTEQLIRLGVGNLVIVDGDNFDESNINRVYGSVIGDHEASKVSIAERNGIRIGLDTKVEPIAKHVVYASVIEELKTCDIVFGCTDDELGRSILNRLAIWYGIPVFDMGVKIDSSDGRIKAVEGRVTHLHPGAACLFCRNRISATNVYAESVSLTDPSRAAELRKEGYIPDLAEPAPAVIAFTTEVAATAISEMLHKLTGFRGAERRSTEVILLIDRTTHRANRVSATESCWCANPRKWCRGDARPLLDLVWKPE
jgi:molybdopterin/thiamine biosynthesis adenylyltransferase